MAAQRTRWGCLNPFDRHRVGSLLYPFAGRMCPVSGLARSLRSVSISPFSSRSSGLQLIVPVLFLQYDRARPALVFRCVHQPAYRSMDAVDGVAVAGAYRRNGFAVE